MRWTEEERQVVKARADAAGLTMNDYLVELVRRDEVDRDGRPVWAEPAPNCDQLPMELSA
ncbi:hypothetical protein D5H78_18825 [Vallicoccus soli]|uniref:Uncharacterized protein n=1 Tax=Vallicoccus soli TaxID=2339232 RepID=A0A3A3YN45_9ACTN|nr:hypothetical protein D5H78_18825 [Vallicoccus soli]